MIRKVLVVALLAAGVLAGCASQDEKTSIERTNEGVKARRNRQYDVAVAKLLDATKAYDNNHTAWFNLGLTYDDQKKYDDAAKAYEKAAKLSSKDAMYHMHLGVARYNAVVADEVKRYAQHEGLEPKDVDPAQISLKGANFEPSMSALKTAVELNPELFRAYYYIGRIHRHNDDAKAAAEAFTASIEKNARFVNPYVGLGELYRRWGYTDEAIQVLKQGKLHVPDDKDRAEMLFALGMAYNDKKDWSSAIPEFEEALKADKNLAKARYQLGLAQLQIKPPDIQKAKKNLEEFQKNAKNDKNADFMKAIAQKALFDIMAMEQ